MLMIQFTKKHSYCCTCLCFRYGVAIVTSDIRSSHSSDEEDSDLKSHHPVRVKRTLLKDIVKQHGTKQEKLPNESKSKLSELFM